VAPVGVTVLEGSEKREVPTELTAATPNTYGVPLVKLLTRRVVSVVESVAVEGSLSTR
jgi:hypothetical protein